MFLFLLLLLSLQDAIILARAAADVSWANIGRELGRRGQLVRHRHETLTATNKGPFTAKDVSVTCTRVVVCTFGVVSLTMY